MNRNFVGASVAASVLTALCGAFAAPPPVDGSCFDKEYVNSMTITFGATTCPCDTYFLGVHVFHSETPCQDSILTIPGHIECLETQSEIFKCVPSVNSIVETLKTYKCECESNTGLEVEIGGVKFVIGYGVAKCKLDSTTNTAVNTDGYVECDGTGGV